jgi:fatty acid-binding protein DegV
MLAAVAADLADRFRNTPVRLRTAWTGDEDIGRLWTRQVQEKYPQFEVTGDPLPISIACHVGPGVLALGLMKKI